MQKLKLTLILSCKNNNIMLQIIPSSKRVAMTTLCVFMLAPYSVQVFLFHVSNHINTFFSEKNNAVKFHILHNI